MFLPTSDFREVEGAGVEAQERKTMENNFQKNGGKDEVLPHRALAQCEQLLCTVVRSDKLQSHTPPAEFERRMSPRVGQFGGQRLRRWTLSSRLPP